MVAESNRTSVGDGGAPDLDLPAETRLQDEAAEGRNRGLWGKLKKGLLMTHTEVLERLDAAVSGRAVLDEATLEILEEALIATDVGVDTALELVEQIRGSVAPRQAMDLVLLRQMMVDRMAVLLLDAPQRAFSGARPQVTLVVGVNGVGKTTSIAKLARYGLQSGERVLLAAADTFRAAAVEQISLWGERLGVDVVRQGQGADPAAVVFDAIQAARARGVDHVLVDTAGRLHNKEHLMAELAKIRRVIEREAADWNSFTLLVLDATTGQNAVVQAREFSRVATVDGVLLAKIDGTAKGGMAVAVARELRLPVVFLGVGEAAEDLVEFAPREFAAALLG